MKLLFDQNISFRIIDKISNNFPEAKQVKQLGLENRPDNEIWEYAKKEGYTIITFDSDFYDLANLHGHPPKIIWLRFGNTPTNQIANCFKSKILVIKDFIESPDRENRACLEIDSI